MIEGREVSFRGGGEGGGDQAGTVGTGQAH